MEYVRVIGGVAELYSLRQLKNDNPDVSFPKPPSDALLASYDVYPVTDPGPPAYNPLVQKIEDGGYTLNGAVWTKVYNVVDKTAQERRIEADEVEAEVAQNNELLVAMGEATIDLVMAAVDGTITPSTTRAQIRNAFRARVRTYLRNRRGV